MFDFLPLFSVLHCHGVVGLLGGIFTSRGCNCAGCVLACVFLFGVALSLLHVYYLGL